MKSEFLMAITQLAAEKNLPKEVVLSAVERALATAYKKDSFSAAQNVSVKINPQNGEVRVYVQKTVVEKPDDPSREITLAEARRLNMSAQVDEKIEVEATPASAGRIAAQTAKQVVLQLLREAEHDAIFEEFHGREADIVTGVVQRVDPKGIVLELGRTQAILPASEQVRGERYRVGQRIKVYLMETVRTPKGPQVLVSRAHRNLLRRLMELEVPEIYNGAVEVKAIAREAGYRSKVAVAARQPGIDPVGCCVGQRGIRIQNIVSELNNEKIDVVLWDPEPSVFVANALSPAQVASVRVSEAEKAATVIVPDRQLSLAIGKDGQNARLAAKLTGWRIDIKSASAVEAERVVPPAAEAPALAEAPAPLVPAGITPGPAPRQELPVPPELSPVEEKVEEAVAGPVAVSPEPVPAGVPVEEVLFSPKAAKVKSALRFAEDLAVPGAVKAGPGGKKAKKRSSTRPDTEEAGGATKAKKSRRPQDYLADLEE